MTTRLSAAHWDIVEKYYPHYYSSSTITLIDILTRVLDGEAISPNDEEFIQGWDVAKELYFLEREVWRVAVKNYLLNPLS